MAAAPILPAVSEEEYLRSDYEPNCEYLDGVLVSKALPDDIHGSLQILIGSYLLSQQERFDFRVASEVHTRIHPGRWRVPDVAILPGRKGDRRFPDEQSPPLLTIEIVSKDEPWSGLHSKMTDHLAVGVQAVIIVDPYIKTVFVATKEQALHEIMAPLVVSVPIAGKGDLQIDFDALFAQL